MPWSIRRVRIRWGSIHCPERQPISHGSVHKWTIKPFRSTPKRLQSFQNYFLKLLLWSIPSQNHLNLTPYGIKSFQINSQQPVLIENGVSRIFWIQLTNCPLFDPFSTKWSIVRKYKTDSILCQLPKHLQNAHARHQQNQRQKSQELKHSADLPKPFSLWITTKEILKAEWKFTTTKWTP